MTCALFFLLALLLFLLSLTLPTEPVARPLIQSPTLISGPEPNIHSFLFTPVIAPVFVSRFTFGKLSFARCDFYRLANICGSTQYCTLLNINLISTKKNIKKNTRQLIMLDNLFSLFSRTSCSSRPRVPRYRPSGAGEEHFNLLVSLQMAIRNEVMDTEKSTAAEMLHGANNVNLRKQVCISDPLFL